MERNDLYQVSNSFRANSSSRWRDTGFNVFSTSFRQEGGGGDDDEEALKWTAIERLPRFARVRKALLTTSDGETCEVDVPKLGHQERKNLMDRLIKHTENDNEGFLLKVRQRVDRVGIEIPKLEVRYQNLRVEAEAYVGSRALPSFFNFFINKLESILHTFHLLSSRKKHVHILRDVSGIIRPCRMTLLLGPPSSGKTTLLLALAGKLDRDLKISGSVTYNGHEMNDFVAQRTAAYIGQNDVHTPELTVRETIAFSARCQGVGPRYEMLAELARREKAANIKPDPDIDVFMKAASIEGQETSVITDYVIKMLGLEICADTLVGDEMIRGVSGGQRKRVTTGEMLAGPAKLLLMDEISTGLDSSTTYQIVKCLRQSIHILNGTAFVSLLQPAPETFELFDDIVLLSDGQIVYQGPREHVLEFFESVGFKCPARKGVADFLQEVTSTKDQRQYWTQTDRPYSFVTVKEFAEAFLSFHVGKKLQNDLATPFDKNQSDPTILTTKDYGVKRMELLKACFSKELLLMKRNSFVYIFKLVQLVVMALIGSSVFLRTEMHKKTVTDGIVQMGAVFFSVFMIMFNGLVELGMTVFKLPIFYKQRDNLFYPAWAYALPTWILKIPISFIEVGLWVVLTYYLMGLDPDFLRFLKQFILLLLTNQMASALFRLIAAVGREMTVTSTISSFCLLVLFANCGFVLSRDEVKKWWIWGYWISPMMYSQNSIVNNEFLGESWNRVIPFTTERLGVLVLKVRGFFTEAYWCWIGVGALVGFILVFNLLYTLALTYLNPLDESQRVTSVPQSNEDDDRSEVDAQFLPAGSNTELLSPKSELDTIQHRKKGMILPFQQHCITFEKIIYAVDMPQAMKAQGVTEDRLVLLRGISGAFRPGVLTALMGVSGAGKTTLMDVLAGRKTGGYIEGSIKISGFPKKQETFARISGYCEQTDIHSPHLTVYESLLYSAWLRLDPEVNSETRKMFVKEVMELVEMTPLRQALVGLPGVSGLSLEQRKRLTIAVELVANPSIVFMDEPTSGLDARAAAIVMRTVRNTVDTGRTVVCTIHQPGIDIFEAFDELLLLKQGGQEIYVGPLGHNSCHLIKYFEGIEGISRIKDGYNPATWMLEVSSTAQEIDLGIDFADLYKNSELHKRTKALIEQLNTPSPGSKELHFPTQYSQSFFSQFLVCLWKQRWSYWRNTSYTAVRFFFTTVIGLMFGTMFWNVGSKRGRHQDLFNSMGSMYAAILFLGVQNATSVQPVVHVERTVFYREKAAGMYSPMAYAFAQVVVELPYIFVQAMTYGIIVYSMMAFEWTAAKFLWYIFFMYFTLLYFTFFGMMTMSITPNFHIAGIISTAFYAIWNLFTGFLVPRTKIPTWWRWNYWLCPLAWTLYGLVVSQYGDLKDVLDTGETIEEFLRNFFGFRHDFLGVVAAVTVGWALLFAFLFAIFIKFFNFQRR
ncbi:pleiotropic drug resistance 12, ATP-binding cassette G40, PLEIOTROPIC DRUG RESISTANCE 12 [Hibiscus trionum]|uniref:Pleiotropic drug resistance 12, ATP-binding cassette G40, PLEIOTROPIC DRUG RESISTANCE 12 n=1 Tax=Hibiscus trionum TaxID=183268 RepID=A0A9W7HQ36_HIBTR|nr:pleiotropic drug resistance 12, ATP-binding cassette G40, PLEIOTROPIC DRUG RESISTANCE 12 [Hibiscus trionum]